MKLLAVTAAGSVHMKKFLAILSGVLALLAAFVLVRTMRLGSRQIPAVPMQQAEMDSDRVVERLSKAIQHRTVSSAQPSRETMAEFDRFHRYLQDSFPAVGAHVSRELVGHSLLYTWFGDDQRLKPVLLMSHMDVVPAEPESEASWRYPPFSGRVAEGHVWGRGTMDDKAGVLGILEAVEHLLTRGFHPQRTIYIAFGHDEEIGGYDGAAKIAELLRARGVELEFVLDEGANVVAGIIPDVAAPVALIGIAEKGYVSLELTVDAMGGHASMPPPRTAIGVLSEAIDKLERSPLPARLSEPTRRMLEFIAPETGWRSRIALANLWLFEPAIRHRFARSPLTNAAIRTTQAFTVFHAGAKENVLPVRARAVMNARILPGETIAGVIQHVERVIGNAQIKVSPMAIRSEPSAVSDTESSAFKLLQRTIKEVVPEVVVAPALLVAATDSRHYAGLTKNIFRFLPITLRHEDASRYHGIDERISIADYERCVRFYVQLIRNSQAS